jgi:histidyl-tRNA synthetase
LSQRKIQAVKGTRDILPDEISAWHRIEAAARELFPRYGYREIRTPVFEETELFARGIGTETDIVSKEMYTFEDQGGSSLTLRPEATAGIVRAVIEHNLAADDPAPKVWAMGPMFRRERPQKGRFRQFHQVDVEAFGMSRPSIDAEMIEVALAYLEACGLQDSELVLNSTGDAKCRPAYVETLRAALRKEAGRLCADCQRRTETNPLRVLDCKVPEDQPIIDALPKIGDHLCDDCRDHFAEVRRELDLLGIRYRLDHRLVRGPRLLHAHHLRGHERCPGRPEQRAGRRPLRRPGQGAWAGPTSPASASRWGWSGWSCCCRSRWPRAAATCSWPRWSPTRSTRPCLLQRDLRRAGLRVLIDNEGRGLKSQMKKADKLGARFVAIRGEDERAKDVWMVRDMGGSSQEEVKAGDVAGHLEGKLRG